MHALIEGKARTDNESSADDNELLTTGDAAQILGISPKTVSRILDSGAIPYIRYTKRGNRWVNRADVLATASAHISVTAPIWRTCRRPLPKATWTTSTTTPTSPSSNDPPIPHDHSNPSLQASSRLHLRRGRAFSPDPLSITLAYLAPVMLLLASLPENAPLQRRCRRHRRKRGSVACKPQTLAYSGAIARGQPYLADTSSVSPSAVMPLSSSASAETMAISSLPWRMTFTPFASASSPIGTIL